MHHKFQGTGPELVECVCECSGLCAATKVFESTAAWTCVESGNKIIISNIFIKPMFVLPVYVGRITK